jgi:two-component system chemotaxis sensor kinase CheA
MARMVRDLARKCGKQVNFHMSGEETELDKNMVEELVDPLTHMVRNAVDHGIELPDERKKQGKIEQGAVSLAACHKGGSVVIELRDDGKGLDHERIRKKAVERGLLGPEENLSEEQIYDLIFKPGFSTAEQVSDVSGRGVGMDVVRRGIEKLRGKVEISSEPNKGSTFSIHLPLTLAIIDGMVVCVGNERYIIPLTSIVRSMRPLQTEIFTIKNEGEMVKVQGDLFPLIRLHKSFDVKPKSEKPWESLVILVESELGRCCLLVDDLVGIQQVVIKGLDEEFRHKKKLSGCTILGDGRVGLILDVNGLVQLTSNRGNTSVADKTTPKPEPVAG